MDREVKHPHYYDIFNSPLGPLYLEFSGKSLTGISFKKPSNIPFRKDSAPERFRKELDSYFRGAGTDFDQEVKFLTGTDFEKKVWSSLREIPFGETRTYKWVAEKVGNPAAVRAVGQALSKNPVPIVIPCHRVIESDGSIGGYSSGVDAKRRLLDMEYYSKINEE
jgi:methylated-DNA-[protein]-cysteine S-methyltransferase